MGFSIKIAPGVRVRASSRGVRTSLGPRAARIHVGGGRTSFSTGFGPVSYSTSGGRRRSSGSAKPRGSANRVYYSNGSSLTVAQHNKVVAAQQLQEQLTSIRSVHHEFFAVSQPPELEVPTPVDREAILKAEIAAALKGVSIFKRRLRKERKAQALAAATEKADQQDLNNRAAAAFRTAQDREAWKLLLCNDPDTVLATLTEAFEDNAARASAINVDGAEATIIVIVPAESFVPERGPSRTAAGNVTTKKLTKKERDEAYRQLVCGHLLVTVKEAFAVAPALDSVRIVAIRRSDLDAYGKAHKEALLAGHYSRAMLEGVFWTTTDADRIVDLDTDLLANYRGVNRVVAPIDLEKEPGLRDLLDTVDFDD